MSVTPRYVLLSIVLLAACGELSTAPLRSGGTELPGVSAQLYSLKDISTKTLITEGGRFAESSYLSCMMSYAAQGLPLDQIRDLCGTQLSLQGEHGWGPDGEGFWLPNASESAFDPSSVSATCGVGDGQIAQSQGFKVTGNRTNPVDGREYDLGEYSWGGRGVCDDSGCNKGLTEFESSLQKEKAIQDWIKASQELEKAVKEAQADPGNPAKVDAAKAAAEAYKAAEAKAKADPNKTEKGESAPAPAPAPAPTPNTSTDGEISPCEQVIQEAREFLAECHRTGWKSTVCQEFHAKLNGCPDPTLIYVDPNSGYECAPAVDPELVIEAWTRMCERNVTPGPDGGSPCSKPEPSASGQTVAGDETDICSNSVALTNPEEDGCFTVMQVDDLGITKELKELILWGQGVFGGPIVVFPPPPPPFPVGS